jgi:hypothetical protein
MLLKLALAWYYRVLRPRVALRCPLEALLRPPIVESYVPLPLT